MRRLADDSGLELRIEHRAGASPQPLHLRLLVEAAGAAARFHAFQPAAETRDPTAARLLELLATASQPLSTAALRAKLGLRNQTVTTSLHALLALGRLERRGLDGWALPAPNA